MDGFLFDWGEDDSDGFFNEDDDQVNKNDPSASQREDFSPYEDHVHCDGYNPDELEEALDYRDEIENSLNYNEDIDDSGTDEIGILEAAAFGGVLGGMISEEDEGNVHQLMSLPEYQQEMSPTKKKKVTLRPFETWVQDVLHGRKDINDL